eukprot:COSAG01_NODE_7105_length_3352_cov_3.350753_2_plen_148_part_00
MRPWCASVSGWSAGYSLPPACRSACVLCFRAQHNPRQVDEVLGVLEQLDGRLSYYALSVHGLDYPNQMLCNEPPYSSYAMRWVAGAGENPPEYAVPPRADGSPGSLRDFVRERGVRINKLWITTRFAPLPDQVDAAGRSARAPRPQY